MYMNIIRCDVCQKDISGGILRLGYRAFGTVELCAKCGEDIKKFLKNHDLLAKSGYEDLWSRSKAV
jgi:hypothetical protein